MSALPDFAHLHDAILNAPPKAVGFPLQSLRNSARLRTKSHLQHMLTQIEEEAERARATPAPALPLSLFRLFEETGDRSQYESAYFDRRRRLAALTLSILLPSPAREGSETRSHSSPAGERPEVKLLPSPNGEGPGVRSLSDLLWEICNEYTWALPAHLPVGINAVRANRLPPEQIVDLFAAETAAALAEVLSLLGDRLDPWLDLRIRQEVERRIFQPLFENSARFAWETEAMNWAAVCAGSAGIAALVLVDDRERLVRVIERVLRVMKVFLSGFPNDGGTPEGIVYWEYGFGFYLYFAEALREYTGGTIDLLDDDHVRRIAAFPNTVALGDNHFVNFSDANATVHLHAGLCARLAERTGTKMPPLPPVDFFTDHIFRWAHITRDIVWSRPPGKKRLANGRFYLPDLAWVIDKRTINGKTIAFAAKGGHNDEPHNHNDLGHFILHVGGESLLADIGAGRYTRQYFGAERYASIHNGAQGHSVPIINGALQQAGKEYRAHLLHYVEKREKIDFTLDLSGAYDQPALRSLHREFHWQRTDEEADAFLQIEDFFSAESPIVFEENLVSLYQPKIFLKDPPNGWVRWQGKYGRVEMRYNLHILAPEVITTPSEDHFGAPITVYTLRLRGASTTQGWVPLMFWCYLHPTPTT